MGSVEPLLMARWKARIEFLLTRGALSCQRMLAFLYNTISNILHVR